MESQQGTGNARDSGACKFTSGNTGKVRSRGCQESLEQSWRDLELNRWGQGVRMMNQWAAPDPNAEPVTQWMSAEQCTATAPPPPPGVYTPPPPPGAHEGEICVDVDTSSHHFTTTPHYVASFGAVS